MQGDIGTGSSENKSRDHDIAVSEPVFHAGNQMEPRLRSGVSGGERYRGKVAVMTPGDLAFFTGMMIGYLAFAGALLFGMITSSAPPPSAPMDQERHPLRQRPDLRPVQQAH